MIYGCHNCEHDGKKFHDYSSSPCASCRAVSTPPPLAAIPIQDLKREDEPYTVHPAYLVDEEVQHKMLGALSRCVLELVKIKEKSPETFKFAIMKLMNPSCSYTEIARKFKCRKQNVLYHMKKAVSICEYLKYALLIDKRYNSGTSAF
ncbi:MAG: hypothetical protein A2020_05500 [Lentisphaerae bacterium GWF2_45_14]|nr:MAG: hypothetical protein A2020_05500 [Lentisphaerae bacterium GWF2_45_14]